MAAKCCLFSPFHWAPARPFPARWCPVTCPQRGAVRCGAVHCCVCECECMGADACQCAGPRSQPSTPPVPFPHEALRCVSMHVHSHRGHLSSAHPTHTYTSAIHRTTATPRLHAQPSPAEHSTRTGLHSNAPPWPHRNPSPTSISTVASPTTTCHPPCPPPPPPPPPPRCGSPCNHAAPFHPQSHHLLMYMHPAARPRSHKVYTLGARSPVACAQARPYPSTQHPKGAPGTSQAPSQHQAVISRRPTFRIPCLVAPPAPGS